MAIINTQEDFLRALSENPEWKAAVRAQILGEELLQLPARFDAFVVNQEQLNARVETFIANQEQFNARQEQFNAKVETFIANQEQFNAKVSAFITNQEQFNATQEQFNATLNSKVDRMMADSARMRGHYARDAAIRSARIIAMEMGLEYVRTVTLEDLTGMVLRAAQGRPLSSEYKSFRSADLVIEAVDGESVQYIAVEASFTGDSRDTSRAIRNAGLLTEFTGHPARPAIASVRNDAETNGRIDSGEVYWHEIPEGLLEPE